MKKKNIREDSGAFYCVCTGVQYYKRARRQIDQHNLSEIYSEHTPVIFDISLTKTMTTFPS